MGRTPDYTINALNKLTSGKTLVGCAWKQDGGRISIKLNPCVVLTDNADIVISLFPYTKRDADGSRPAVQETHDHNEDIDAPVPGINYTPDDIPF